MGFLCYVVKVSFGMLFICEVFGLNDCLIKIVLYDGCFLIVMVFK